MSLSLSGAELSSSLLLAVLDMHGVPGSQNGEQSSGHLTTSPSFFGGDANTVSQRRSDEMIKAVIQFVETSPYRSVITGIEVSFLLSFDQVR